VAVADGLGAITEAENVGVRLRLYALGLRVEVDDWLRLSSLPGGARSEFARLRSTVDKLSAGVDRVGQLGGRSFLPDAGALRLLCAAERARWDDLVTPAQWAQVGAAWESLDRPYPAAYALWREAEAAAGSKDRTRAISAARQAHRTVVRLGARPLRDEIEALARRARLDLADVPAHIPEPATPVDPFGLTQREREVLHHLCQGQSNRQIASALFVTDKTASVHVSNILMKLGVTSRGAAAAVAHRLGLCAEPDIPNHQQGGKS
jgi:DNA-binding CsgD family transcriptional regulator